MNGPDPGFEVRRLGPADAPAYASLRAAMLVDSPRAFSASPGHDPFGTEAAVRASLARVGEQAIVGAYRRDGEAQRGEGRLVGAAGMFRETKPKMSHLAMVWGVWVEPQSRGMGVAEAVMRKMIEVGRGWKGVRSIGLSAGAGQVAARRLYERLGFVEWGIEPGVMMVDGELHDEVHMQLRV